MGKVNYQYLKQAGFDDERIQAYFRPRLSSAGFTDTQINQYFQNNSGERALSLAGMEQNETIKSIASAAAEVQNNAFKEGKDLDFMDAIQLGLQQSVSGMLKRGKLPDEITEEQEKSLNFFEKAAMGVSGIIADTPWFFVGGSVGGAVGGKTGGLAGAGVGSVVPGAGTAAGAAVGTGVGAVVGSGAGAFAFHAALRQTLVNMYKEGGVASFGELMDRVGAEAGKASLVGAAAGGAGMVAKAFMPVARIGAGRLAISGAAKAGMTREAQALSANIARKGVEKAMPFGAEVLGLTGASSLVDGHIPTANDFLDSAAMILLLRGTHRFQAKGFNELNKVVVDKLYDRFIKTGESPSSIAQRTRTDPVLAQDMLAEKTEVKVSAEPAESAGAKAALPPLIEREGGPKISKDLSNIMPIEIGGEVPQFDNFTMFRKWVMDTLGNIGSVRIQETGQDMRVNRDGAKRSLKRHRDEGNNAVYADFKKAVESAKYRGSREITKTDKSGKAYKAQQDVFTNKIRIGTNTYDLEIYADVGRYNKNNLSYAGHKVVPAGIPTASDTVANRDNNSIPQKPVEVKSDTPFSSKGAGTEIPVKDGVSGAVSGDNVVRRSDIMRDLVNSIDIPVRQGKVSSRRAAGEYYEFPEMIRLRKANDIATAAHEIGHHLEKTLFGETASGKLGEYGDELSKIATKPKGSPTKAAIEAEGFAEFIAKYVANPEEARKAAPKFYKFFEKEIAAKDPEMHAVLLNAREKVRLWAEQLAQARVLAQIAIGDRPSDLTTRQKWQRLKNKFYEEALDRFNPVKELVKGVEKKSGQKIDFENNPYYLMRLFQGWAGKVEHFLQHATFDYKTYENTGKSLREIIMQTHNLNELRTYLVSRRAIELHVRGIESGIRIEDAKQSVKELGAQYRHISEDLYKYQDALLKMQLDGGLISRDSYEAIKKENAARVPFYRVIEEGENYTLGGKSLKSRRLIKGIKGSTRDIIDPLESIIKDTAEVINAVERNRIGLAIADLAKADKAGEFVFKVPADLKKGQSLEGGEFWQRSETIDKNNEIKVFRDGKAEIYEVDKDIAAIVNGLNPSEANIFMRGMGAFAGMLRAGATGYNPTFAIKNIAKDMLFATTGTKSGFNPFKTLPENIKISVKKSEIYWEMQKAGGGFANLVSLDRNVLQENLRTLTDTGYTGRVWNAISEKQFLKAAKLGMFDPLIGSARYLSETSEQTTRVGEFKSSMKGKEATKANLEKAAFNAREITLDFAKGGNTVRAINTVAAFFNANVQGLIKTGSILADPKRAPKAIAILGTIGILEAVAGWDWETGAEDADIAEVNRTQRDINYVFKAGGVIWRIPKPQNIGYISTGFSMATTALLNSMNKQDNDDLGKNLAKAFWKEFNMNPLPNAISVPIEAWANKSAFFDRPIVPAYAEDMLPEYQYTANTHELTKVISEKLGGFIGRKNTFSPAKAEHMLRGWTGGVGSFLLEASDYSLRKAGMLPDAPKASDTLSDIPFVRAFTIRNPSGSAESVQKFYERYNDTQTYVKTFNFALKSGNVKDAQELAVYAGFKGLDGVNNALRENAALIRNINKNPGISADEKRQAIDNLYFIMTQHAKLGNKMWQEIEAQRKAR